MLKTNPIIKIDNINDRNIHLKELNRLRMHFLSISNDDFYSKCFITSQKIKNR